MEDNFALAVVVDDDPDVALAARLALRDLFARIETVETPARLFDFLKRESPDVILLDLNFERSATDGRYVYLRHFMPHRIYGQHIAYLWEMPTTQVWKKQFDEGKLNAAQQAFWKEKPPEELYDLHNDPDEVRNLAGSPEHRATVLRMRKVVHDWMLRIRDVGILPECDMLSRSGESLAPYAMAANRKQYPLAEVLGMAEVASLRAPAAAPELGKRLRHRDRM